MKRYLIVASVLMLVLGGSVAIAETGDGEAIHACAKTNNGQLRIVDGPDDCNKSEYYLAWNEEGPPGVLPTHYTRVVNSAVIPSGHAAYPGATAACDPGDQATGGGFGVSDYFRVGWSFPVGDPPTGWHVKAKNISSYNTTFGVWVVCADMTP